MLTYARHTWRDIHGRIRYEHAGADYGLNILEKSESLDAVIHKHKHKDWVGTMIVEGKCLEWRVL